LARKILLADDSVTAQNMGRKILADAGYEVITVNNGSAALKKIAELRPDLIVLDVYMPGYSGLEVCQRLKDAQETARIPVLLTVGKLEPFKAEEAQRVRADAFIVKPFEASELLSALSKLEDKVVPRAEAKPGRYTRFAAPGDSSSRGPETTGDPTSWKERIAFPGPKKNAEGQTGQKTQDETALYNPINRDLRTVVDKAVVEKEAKPAGAMEPTVNVSAAVPESFPKDVTPEELAAITAAMAQMQNTLAHADQATQPAADEQSASATPSVLDEKAAPTTAVAVAPATETVVSVAAEAADQIKAVSATTESSTAPESTVAEPVGAKSSHAPPAEVLEELPVTMTVAAGVSGSSAEGPCWMAVPVAVAAEEAATSLEQEMQKAYAAFAAADANCPGFVESLPSAPAAAEISAATGPEPMAILALPEPDRALSVGAPASAWPAPAQEAASSLSALDSVAPAGAAETRVENSFAVVSGPEFGSSSGQPENSRQAQDAPPEAFAAATMVEPEAASTPEPVAVPEAGSEAAPEVATAAAPKSVETPVSDLKPQEDPETVATAAAAWASWRQIRDAGEPQNQPVPAPAFEIKMPDSTSAETASRAVAAGAEQIEHETSAAARSENSADVASIVESVLADLRPKLMEEISKKLAGEKR